MKTQKNTKKSISTLDKKIIFVDEKIKILENLFSKYENEIKLQNIAKRTSV